jgi:hypothetical protein
MLENCDRAGGGEAPVPERQRFGGADDELCLLVDALIAREPSRGEDALDGEVTAHGFDTPPRRLDHRRAGSADADVEIRAASVEDAECVEYPLDVAEPPVLERVRGVVRELRVEVVELVQVLFAELVLGDQDGHAVDGTVLGAAVAAAQPRSPLCEPALAAGADDYHSGAAVTGSDTRLRPD